MADAKERAMDDQIGVAADGRGEMGVFGFGQTVMAERLDRIPGPHERFEKANLERLADGDGVELLQQFLHLRTMR